MIYLSLIHNIALLVALTFVHSLLVRRLSRDGMVYRLLSGLLFGGVSVMVMMTPLILLPGLIIDGRSIILCVAGLFCGPLTALVAAVIATAYRLWLGGVGALPGIAVIAEAASLGVVWHYLRRRRPWAMGTPALYLFGLLVHCVMIAILLLALPAADARHLFSHIALPVLLLYPPATLLLCMLFLMMEQHISDVETLKRSEERMRLFFGHQLVGMAITSPQKEWVQVNDKFCRMLGRTREELTLLSWADLTHAEDLAQDLTQYNRLLAGEIDDYSLEKRFLHKDGSIVHTNLSVGCARRSDGSVDQVLALFEDITARKQADDALRFSEEKFSAAFHVSPDAIIINRLSDGMYRDVNEGFSAITGYRSEEVSGKTARDIAIWVDPEDRVRIKSALCEHGFVDKLEARFRRKDGAVITGLISARPMMVNGEACVLSIASDISERKLLELKRDEDQRFLQTILDSVSDFIFYKDKNGIFLGCNDAYATRYIGLPKDRIIGHPDIDFVPDRQLVSKYLESDRQAMESGSPVLIKAWITQAIGHKILIEVLKTPFYNAAG